MQSPTLKTVVSGYFSNDILNENFNTIAATFEQTLDRFGSLPNTMEADLDMNSNDILNVKSLATQTLILNGQVVVPEDTLVVVPTYDVTSYGATGDGVTDDTAAIQSAINAAGAAGGGKVYFPAGTYFVSSALSVTDDNIRMEGDGPFNTVLTKGASTNYILVTGSGMSGTALTLSADASANDATITLTDASSISAGDFLVLYDDREIRVGSGGNTRAEFVHVHSKSGNTLTLSGPVKSSYETVQNASVEVMSFLTGFQISGIGFDGVNKLNTSGTLPDDNVMELDNCRSASIDNVAAWDLPNVFIRTYFCYNTRIHNVSARNQDSNGVLGGTGFGYSVIELSLNQGMVLSNLTAHKVRHAYTTATNGVQKGMAYGSRITNCTASDCLGAGFDTHPEGFDIGFDNCASIGSQSHGFQARCFGTTFSNCMARNCLASGFKVNLNASRTFINNCSVFRCDVGVSGGGIHDDGAETVVFGGLMDRCGGPGLRITGNADAGLYKGLVIRDPCQNGAVTSGILNNDDGPLKMTFEGCTVTDNDGNVATSVEISSTTPTEVRFSNMDIRGYTDKPYGFTGGLNVVVTNGSAGITGDSIGLRQEYTIATGVINPKISPSTFIEVNGEGGLADDLVTIDGTYPEGTRLTLVTGNATITVKHGTGNIFLDGGVDAVLTTVRDNITLVRIASSWMECGRGIV